MQSHPRMQSHQGHGPETTKHALGSSQQRHRVAQVGGLLNSPKVLGAGSRMGSRIHLCGLDENGTGQGHGGGWMICSKGRG